MTQSGSGGGNGSVGTRRARFDRWRRGRPFAGGALLVVASLVIAWIPINIAPDTILIGETLSPIGLLFAALVFLCGIFALTRPGNADIFGIFGVVFSIFSLYGALGGFIIGTGLGIIGGVLCYAWRDEDTEDGDNGGGGSGGTTEADFEFTDDGADGEGSDDGLFGTRSPAQRAVSADGGGAGGRTASIALLLVSVIVLGAFAHPLMTAAARDFPEQEGIDGTVVVADEFSGSGFNHENVTTDSSNRESVPAGKFSFKSNVNIEGLTMYKNFRGGPGGASHLTIKGSSASAPGGLSLTASEAYFGRLGIGKDPVVIPAARKKWSTCPGEDFLFSIGDLGPLPGPPIDSSKVVTNTHQLSAQSITIENLELTMQGGTKSTSVSGTPECTKNPIEPVLDLITANALALLTDEGVISPNVTTNNFTVSDFAAPTEVQRNESYDVNATVTNAGYIGDETTVTYRRDGETLAQRNVTLGPDNETTVSFTDIGTDGLSPGEYDHAITAGANETTGTLTITAPNSSANASNASANVSTAAANGTNASANATSSPNRTSAGNETSTPDENGTTTTSEPTTTAEPTTAAEPTTSTATPTPTPSGDAPSTTATDTASPTPTATDAPTATTTEAATAAAAGAGNASATTESVTPTARQNSTNGSSLIGTPVLASDRQERR
ncbi:DUF6114 domain-containing protein [Halococcus dombrowskii]|uniref:DUF6114 domain-containing protein n=1 Tax=Halococcus dombrowskii TaxID=179637 RepID=A0AAV3SJ11_HALDO|nr:DUF6114 domain-containing protein [Halococcus dombrowskii]UOO95903.1 DUF6114 domain-containing protein [Halococcus dombrowskii]